MARDGRVSLARGKTEMRGNRWLTWGTPLVCGGFYRREPRTRKGQRQTAKSLLEPFKRG
jgi:hypothetical protein